MPHLDLINNRIYLNGWAMNSQTQGSVYESYCV